MAATSQRLESIENISAHHFVAPTKRINDGDDLAFFFVSKAYRDLTKWLLQLDRSMFPSSQSSELSAISSPTEAPRFSHRIEQIRSLLSSLSNLIEKAPPDTGPRRFGNVAFRAWYKLVEDDAADLVKSHLDHVIPVSSAENAGNVAALVDELTAYLVGSFGSPQRLDYGTGHELSFLAFLGCLWKLRSFEGDQETAIVTGVIQPYLELVRRLIITYTLEPAGSHGVWGLDDHSFLPYIFGSAQLGPPIPANDHSMPIPTEGSLLDAPLPSSVIDKAIVARLQKHNMYFSAIQFIYDVKKGPFWEHSPVLYDVSGIKDGWGKINKGMLKMYVAEVLGKFPVVQHFPFGSLFEWVQDPDAAYQIPSVHSQQQPAVMQSKDISAVGPNGTAAPWLRASQSGVPQMQADTGMPSTRAPWASSVRVGGISSADLQRQRGQAQSMGAPTAAPKTQRDGTR